MITRLAEFLAKKTKKHPLVLHINAIGLIRLGKDNQERLKAFNSILKKSEDRGGNIAIPTYSYSYTQSEDFDLLKTPSVAGAVTEYIRRKNLQKRTVDALFSYVLLGKNFSKKHYQIRNYVSFGEDSLIEEIFIKDGYIGSVGGVLKYLTEIHFLEWLLGVNYRFNKTFEGYLIDKKGEKHKQTITFFCRDLSLGLKADLTRLESDIKKDEHVKVWKVDGLEFEIEIIKIKAIYNFIKEKLKNDKLYLCVSV